MSRSSGRSGQTELSAVIAVFAVCAGLSLYAGQVATVRPPAGEPRTADVVADRLIDVASRDGVVVPSLVVRAEAAPPGTRLAVTLTGGPERWRWGPARPADARTASRRVAVRLGPGRVRAGWLRVAIWR